MFDSVQEFEFAFDVWNKNKDSIVGYQPYSHKTVDSVGRNHQYNMMSSKMMLMKSDFLYAYSCLLPSQIHHYVDQHPDCLDVAINMLTSGMTGAAPLLVDNKFVNHSITSSLSGSNCIRDLTSFFDDKNTLVLNNQMVKSV